MSEDPHHEMSADANRRFATTHWSVVLAAREDPSAQAQAALEQLCGTYWYPLYAYVRASGYSVADAEDLTQEFFSRLMDRRYLRAVQPARGKFRWFLLCAVKRFLLKERRRNLSVKRGGRVHHVPFDGEKAEQRFRLDAADTASPDLLFDRAWVSHLIETAYERLEEEYTVGGKKTLFERFGRYLSGDPGELTYAQVGAGLRMTEGAVKVAVHRLRRRYRDLLREQVAETVHSPADLEGELRTLQSVFRG